MAKEYIEREAAKHELLSGAVCVNHPEYLMKDDALHVIDSIPDADVVEVVRCKDCEYFRYNFENNPYCKRVDGLCDPGLNEFCSLGVRRDRND